MTSLLYEWKCLSRTKFTFVYDYYIPYQLSLTHRYEHTTLICPQNIKLNYANPEYGVATICHQVRCLHWGHPSPFQTATALLIWHTMFCMRDISYRLISMKFINILSVYAQSGTQRRFNWWIIDCKSGRHILWHCTSSLSWWWHGINLDWDYTWSFKSPSCYVDHRSKPIIMYHMMFIDVFSRH